MTKTTTSTGSASDNERMLRYKALAAAFSYPDNDISLSREYDRLFRTGEVWLYGAEYVAKSEFQRSNCLSDIMGFYMAFGVEPDLERPDALSSELEFMHYLIFKELNAPNAEKASICRDARKKFFVEHLYPEAKRIAEEITLKDTKSAFYKEAAEGLLAFLESERRYITR